MVELGNFKRTKITEMLKHVFRDREIIVRSAGKITYFSLKSWVLVVLLLTGVAATGWVAYSSLDYLRLASQISDKNKAIWSAQNSYGQLLDQVSEYRLSIVGITKDLKETQSTLLSHFKKEEIGITSISEGIKKSANGRLLPSEENKKREVLGQQFALIGQELRRMTGKNNALESHIGNLRGNLETVEAEKAEMVAEREAMGDQLWSLNNNLENSHIKTEQLNKKVKALSASLRAVMVEKDQIQNKNEALRAEVVKLESTKEEQALQHEAKLRDISSRALKNIHRLEAVLNRTGLNLKDIAPLPKSMIMGMGGPFIPYHPDMKHSDGNMLLESELELRLNRFEKLRDTVSVLPLVAPVRSGYVSSHYGRRKDPFNGRWAKHRGIDFVAPYKSKVEATAPGIVSYVGRRGRYGRTVDIRHKHGLMTRFAHLYRYRVKVGQKVKMGDTIGLLGNSGRSTGPHVHYEIRHNGKFMNPRRFLRATRNVQ